MFENYDAKAIAEVLGIAFVRSGTDLPSSTRSRNQWTKLSRGSAQSDLLIRVAGGAFAVVEAKSVSSGRQGRYRSIAPFSATLIEKAVAKGLPRNSLRHLAESIAGYDEAKISALERRVVPKTTLERRETKLSPHESELTERVARLLVHARRALGSDDEARVFMTSQHPELDGQSPIDASKTDLGTRRAERILNALEFGLAL
jgi:putative toxin-antitoxin system antitoxin component (TIGR02293 family)